MESVDNVVLMIISGTRLVQWNPEGEPVKGCGVLVFLRVDGIFQKE